MPARKLFPKSDWQRFAQQLEGLPGQPDGDRLAVREAVSELAGRIRAAQAKGYTLEQITARAKANGIDISASTLKAAMRHAGKRTGTLARKRRPDQDRHPSVPPSDRTPTAAPAATALAGRPVIAAVAMPATTTVSARGTFRIRPDTDDL